MQAMSKSTGRRTKTTKPRNPASAISEKQRKRNVHRNSIANLKPFVPGVSGNPGGVRKGTVFISEAYKRILALPVEEFLSFEPNCVAEQIALGMAQRARCEFPKIEPLPYVKEITDRTEGRALANLNVTTMPQDEQARIEAAVAYVMRKAKCNRETAIEALVPQIPEVADLGRIG